MPRKGRGWFPGAIHHVTARGNHKLDIFREEEDRLFYKATLLDVIDLYPFYVHAYCLMTNHVHLQIETIEENIGKVIWRTHMLYAQYFNKKYSTVGHLFQGRYRSELIDSHSYFLETSRYIHLNPIRAGLVEKSVDYPWSSYPAYVREVDDVLVTKQKTLGYFLGGKAEFYEIFVESKVEKVQTK